MTLLGVVERLRRKDVRSGGSWRVEDEVCGGGSVGLTMKREKERKLNQEPLGV